MIEKEQETVKALNKRIEVVNKSLFRKRLLEFATDLKKVAYKVHNFETVEERNKAVDDVVGMITLFATVFDDEITGRFHDSVRQRPTS